MKNKDKILNIIKFNNCGITAKGIGIHFGDTIDKTTIYRNIQKLLLDGYILEDFSKSGEKLYSIKENHHHHFICDECNETENIGCLINSEISSLENKFGFKIKNHSFVINGICKKCA